MIENQRREEEAERFLMERERELKEHLDRKEFVMQQKEKKWAELERMLLDYTKTDENLK